MPPSMPDTSVKHLRRNQSQCILQLPGELLDAGNCLQLVGASPAESPRGLQWNWSLCRSEVKHLAPRKRAGCCSTCFAPFWSCAGTEVKKTLKLSPTRGESCLTTEKGHIYTYIGLYHCQIMHILTVRGLTFNVLLGESLCHNVYGIMVINPL